MFFSHFHPKYEDLLHLGVRTGCGLGSIDAGSLSRSCGSSWLVAGGTCWTIQECTGMSLGDDLLEIDMGCGCFFLVAG